MFEIGKKYKTRDGATTYTVVAKTEDGRLIIDLPNSGHSVVSQRVRQQGNFLRYRDANGAFMCAAPICDGSCHQQLDLVDPDEITEKERELLIKIYEAIGFHSLVLQLKGKETPTKLGVLSVLNIIRDIRNART